MKDAPRTEQKRVGGKMKKRKPFKLYANMPHPKDFDGGAVYRVPSPGYGAAPAAMRGTVLISLGYSDVEMTPDVAQKFVEIIQSAIDWVKHGDKGK